MRSLLKFSAIVAVATACTPVDEALLEQSEGVLSAYVFVACSHDPATMPKTIPEAVGKRNVARYLCEWARLSKDMFLQRASEVIQDMHSHVMDIPTMRAALQRNIDSARSEGAKDDDEVLAVLAERYRQMLRSLDECKPILKL